MKNSQSSHPEQQPLTCAADALAHRAHGERVLHQRVDDTRLDARSGAGTRRDSGVGRRASRGHLPTHLREEIVIEPEAKACPCRGGEEDGWPTEALVANVLVSEYADHLPLYRQAQILAREDIAFDRTPCLLAEEAEQTGEATPGRKRKKYSLDHFIANEGRYDYNQTP